MYRLHKGLLKLGVDSFIFTREKISHDERVIRFNYPQGIHRVSLKLKNLKLEKQITTYCKPTGFEKFASDQTAIGSALIDQLPESDIIHLHWTSGFADIPLLLKTIKIPVVWTLHDMWPFTGGCHYSAGCNRFVQSCGCCPQLGSNDNKDLSNQIWKRKKIALSKLSENNFIACADSNWLRDKARQSSLFRDLTVQTIHYGIENKEFTPLDKPSCRKALLIPDGVRVICFGAPGIDNPRKGFSYLVDALNILSKNINNLFLISFGGGKKPSGINLPWMHLGHVSDNKLLSLIYNTADVFVIPSTEEAFGQTCLEAMSCGIPAVGFADAGGVTDMIINGETGQLAPEITAASLAMAIDTVLSLDLSIYSNLAFNCRKLVQDKFTLDIQAKNYTTIYKRLLKLK
jgi:glycosyltransferase involved in cell wall biosynthesis